MDQSLFGYAIPSMMAEFDIGLSAIGWILSGSFIVAAMSIVIIGALADRYGRRIMFIICLSSSALFVGLQAFAPNLATLALFRAIGFGLATGLVPITNTYVVEAAPARLRGVMTGLLQCGYPIGWAFASLITVPLIEEYGWRTIFLPAFLVIPLTFVLSRLLPESRRFEMQQARASARPQRFKAATAIKELFQPALRRRTFLGFVAFFCFGGAYAGTAFYFPTFFNEFKGYSEADAAFIVGLSYGIGVIGYIGASIVGEFVTTRRNTTVIWTWIGAISLIVLVWFDHSYTGDLVWFGVMATFFYGTSAVLTTFISEIFPTRLRATAVAVTAGVAINLGFAIFPVLVAAAVDTIGWQWAFTAAVFPSLFLCGLAVLGLENKVSGIELEDVLPHEEAKA